LLIEKYLEFSLNSAQFASNFQFKVLAEGVEIFEFPPAWKYCN
jgi:hypothetical protein